MDVLPYMPGDKVYYKGEKYRDRLGGKVGWIHWRVLNDPDRFIVWFPDTRNVKDPEDTDDYIIHVNHLTPWRPSEKDKKQEGPEIQPRRRKKSEETE